MTDSQRIPISDAIVEVVSYPRNEGEPHNKIGDILYVAVTFPNGQRLLHRDLYPCFTEELTPEDAHAKADTMARRIIECGSIDPQYWHKDCHHFIGKHPLGPRLRLEDIKTGDMLIGASSIHRFVHPSDLGLAIFAGFGPCADQYEFELVVKKVAPCGVYVINLCVHRWAMHESPEDVEVESSEEDSNGELQLLPLQSLALFRHPFPR